MGWAALAVLALVVIAWVKVGGAVTVTGLAVILLVAVTGSRTVFSRQQWRRMKWKTILRLRPNEGFASLPEVWFRWGRVGALHYGRRARPSMGLWRRLFGRTTQYALRLGRAQYFRRIYASLEHQVLRLAPPRKGKTGDISNRVMDHRGACLVHETRPDTFFATAGYRAMLGPVQTFNPDLLGGIPSTFKWAMTAGCDDPAEAFYRAADLVGAVADHGEMQWWSEKARGVLAAAVHAAGLPTDEDVLAAKAIGAGMQAAMLAGADMSAVWEWAYGDDSLIQQRPRPPRRLQAAIRGADRTEPARENRRLHPHHHEQIAGMAGRPPPPRDGHRPRRPPVRRGRLAGPARHHLHDLPGRRGIPERAAVPLLHRLRPPLGKTARAAATRPADRPRRAVRAGRAAQMPRQPAVLAGRLRRVRHPDRRRGSLHRPAHRPSTARRA